MDKEKSLRTKVRNILRMSGVVRSDENYHTLVDVSRLKNITEDELKRMRNVGSTTIGFIMELKKSFDWL